MSRLRLRTDAFDVPAPLPFPGPDAEGSHSARVDPDPAGAWRRRDAGRLGRTPGRGAGREETARIAAAIDATIGRAQAALDDLADLVDEDERALAPLPFRRYVIDFDPDDGPRAA